MIKNIARKLCLSGVLLVSSLIASDYNKDGNADILIKTKLGDTKAWFMSRTAKVGQMNIAGKLETADVVSEGDYNGDGYGDMIAKNTDGTYDLWIMGAAGKTKQFLSGDKGWIVVGSGDFDGDGDSDILWKRSDGSLLAWYMDGGVKSSYAFVTANGTYASVEGIEDMDHDGKEDVVITRSGNLAYFAMGASGKTGSAFVAKERGETVAGLGDFDGNGYGDILVKKADGSTVIWYMDASGKASNFKLLGAAKTGWTVQDVEDYNNDGYSDVLFTKTNGDVIIWFMQPGGVLGKVDVTVNEEWTYLPFQDIFQTVVDVNFTITHSLNNQGAYVTSQCYTKTEDTQGGIHNPCFTCHINSEEPNYIDDPDLQESYDMGAYTKINRFTNLFKDRTEEVSRISDYEILSYVRQNNYKDNNNTLLLAEKLKNVPAAWDVNGNGVWDGYTPDCYFSFDNEGFDKSPEGNYTGWRAFGYYPFLGTFWPTNGSTDDVLIRLPKVFREDANGDFNLTIYKVNLAVVESLIKKADVTIDPVDEDALGVDLNQDGNLSVVTQVKYYWGKPDYNLSTGKIQNFTMWYVGAAKPLLESNDYLIAPGLYPKGTDFLHTVRYIDIDENTTTIKMAPRMKEFRYGKKTDWNSYAQLYNASLAEIKEKDAFPDRLRTIRGNSEDGLETGLGWVYQGFIEDQNGDLRPQNYEETMYCIGCHSGIGAIEDSTFVFPRKFDHSSYQKGWYHWSQKAEGLKNIPEPKTKDGLHDEYAFYLEKNHAGDEFRDNDEVMNKFFDANGSLIATEIAKIKTDISYLLYPSVSRALMLNKAYKVIVDEQSFIYGRDAHVKPVENVHKEVTEGQPTGISRIVF